MRKRKVNAQCSKDNHQSHIDPEKWPFQLQFPLHNLMALPCCRHSLRQENSNTDETSSSIANQAYTSFANIETWALYLTSLYLKSAIIKTQPYQQYTSNTVQHRKTATLIRKASYKISYWYSRLCVYYLLAATTHCGQPKKRKRRSTMKKVILEHLSAQHHAMMLHTSK